MTRRRRSGPLVLAALAILATLAALVNAAPAAAQSDSVLVRGVVVTAGSGDPVAGAEVRVADAPALAAVAGPDGRFALVGEADFPLTLRVRLLGYREAVRRVQGPGAVVRVELDPEPVLLEGVEVVADRFDQRLRAIPARTRVVDRERIVSANAHHGVDVLQQRWGFREVACSRRTYTERSRCYSAPHYAGPFELWIDDLKTPFGGLEELASIPPEEIWRIELVGSRQIRVYTEEFVERRARLMPVVVPP